MTTITTEEALKSKKNFEEFMADYYPPIVTSTLADYPKANGQTVVSICDLTQKMETMVSLLNKIESLNLKKAPFIVWYVTSEKEELVTASKALNNFAIKGIKIFIFKAFLNEDKMKFECLLKPDILSDSKGGKAKQLQLEYWTKYSEICDLLGEGDYQIIPKPQHWQYLPLGKTGISFQLTINTRDSFIGVDLCITNNVQFFDLLNCYKTDIEQELGALEWINKSNIKTARIRKTINIEITQDNFESIARTHIEIAKEFKKTVSKYL